MSDSLPGDAPRTEGTEPRLLYPDAVVGTWRHGQRESGKSVWVRLDAV